MLFSSHVFIFLFLPITLFVYLSLGARSQYSKALAWLTLTSLVFYAWWNPPYLAMILLSCLFNFGIGLALNRPSGTPRFRRLLLCAGIGADLLLLGYYKYIAFAVSSLAWLFDKPWSVESPLLPLAISFFTFQQIAYLVDVYQRQTREYRFMEYMLFVTWFPQLIAGPIVHHKEVLPQFASRRVFHFNPRNLAVGLTIFTIGLAKKVLIADPIALYATPVFSKALEGGTPGAAEAWVGALAYTFQLYFDFSGYSDMAVGLGRLFGIRLPQNFDAPYKAANIVDFWRRWHITLSRFLRDYLYIPLGGSRCGKARRYFNLLLTMVLGGLWHGAGWAFAAWGALHGLYLCINHAWHALRKRLGWAPGAGGWPELVAARGLTFLAVIVGWVLFRAEDFGSAMRVLKGMCGVYGWGGASPASVAANKAWPWLALLIVAVNIVPTTQEVMRRYRPVIEPVAPLPEAGWSRRWALGWLWRFTPARAVGLSVLFVWTVLYLTRVSEFLYYQF
ncbi:MAG: MBOAT family protein [Planctomycetes bacterium]|nr:MBOAT family protein [Planctomycetota bacterium]